MNSNLPAGRSEDEVNQNAAVAAAVSGPHTRAIVRVVLITLCILLGTLAAIFIVRSLTSVILLVVLAIFFAYLVAPLVEFVRRPFKLRGQKRLMPRPIAIAIVYVVLFGSLGFGTSMLYPTVRIQIEEFISHIPGYVVGAKQSNLFNRLNRRYEQLPLKTREAIDSKLSQTLTDLGESLLGLTGLVAYLPWFILIPILGFFFLKDVESFRRSTLQMLPSGRWRWRADEFFQDVNSTLAAYIRAQLIACFLIGAICTIGFTIMGLRYALLLGIMAGLLEFIPLVGPLVVAVIVSVIAAFDSSRQLIGVLLFLGILRIIHDYVTYPRIIGQGIHLHPLAVILAILSGAELAGVAGIFLAIPVVAIGTVTYRHWLEHRGSSGLVADLLTPDHVQVNNAAAPNGDTELGLIADTSSDDDLHPSANTTSEDMARARPDLTSGELRMPDLD